MIRCKKLSLAKPVLISLFIFICTRPSNAQDPCIVAGPDANVTVCASQLPYVWNGNAYNAAGSYMASLVSAAGCDSIIHLNLSITNILTGTTNIHLCTAQLPYVWNGNVYNAQGSYNVTLVSAAGCDSIATLNLTVSPVIPGYTNIMVCYNQLPYFWNGNGYVLPGAYAVTLISSSGCDSLAHLVLSVVDVSTSTTATTVCSTQLPYVWNGHTYTAPGNYAVPFITATGCDSVANLTLRLQNNWTGNMNSSWEEPGNWSCNTVPDAYTNVVIESGTPALHSNTIINSVKLAPTANLTVDAGFMLTIEQVAPL